MIRDLLTHVVVSSIILLVALAAAAWIRPLTARTRHAILAAGLFALVLPAPLISTLLERNEITALPRITGGALFNPPPVTPGAPRPAVPPVRLIAAIWLGVAGVLLLR